MRVSLRRSVGLLLSHLTLAVFVAVTSIAAVDAPWSGDRTQILGEVSSGLVGLGIMLLTLARRAMAGLNDEEIYKIARGNAIAMLDLPDTIPGQMNVPLQQPVGAST